MDHVDRKVTQRVIEARERAGLSKAELADRLRMSRQAYWPYEVYKQTFSVSLLHRISTVLDVPLAALLDVGASETMSEFAKRALLELERVPESLQPLALDLLRALGRQQAAKLLTPALDGQIERQGSLQ